MKTETKATRKGKTMTAHTEKLLAVCPAICGVLNNAGAAFANRDPEVSAGLHNAAVILNEARVNAEPEIARLRTVNADLLAACRAIVRSAGYESGEAEPALLELSVGRRCLDAARAAIAKATE